MPTISNDPDVQINSYLFVNNFGLSDSQILAYRSCATNIQQFNSMEAGSKFGAAVTIDSKEQADENELSHISVDETTVFSTDNAEEDAEVAS
jgi:hypothetical protein